MSTLLLHLQGNKLYNKTLLPPQLNVYDDLLLYKKRYLISQKEVTISYNQIAKITLNKGIFFASLDIETTGSDDIIIKFLNKKTATQAKKIIDQKIYFSHAKHHDEATTIKSAPTNIERSLERLKELVAKGNMTEREYEKKRKQLLSNL